MTSRIIYHDFQQTVQVATQPASTTYLTASVLKKGRRRIKTAVGIHTAVNTLFIALCGACCGISLFILYLLSAGF